MNRRDSRKAGLASTVAVTAQYRGGRDMQIDMSGQDTDQKQGNAMNNNPQRCDSSQEKRMNAITKAMSVAVLVALGLTLTGRAAEPPKPEPQKGNDTAGAAGVSRSAPVEGEPVDMGRWAYVFRQGVKDNPWETRWLDPMDKMLWGALWEEAIDVARVEVEFPAGVAVSADDLRVMVVQGGWCPSAIDWLPKSEIRGCPVALKPSTSSASAPVGKNVLAFDGVGISPMKLAVFNIGDKRLPVPQVRVYCSQNAPDRQFAGLRRWFKPQTVEIEWGFDDKAATAAVEGRLEAFWGEILRIEPLEEGNGLKSLDGLGWREEVVPGPKRRGLRVTVACPARRHPDLSQRSPEISLRTGKSGMAFSMADLDGGPILVPSVGVYVAKAGGVPARKFQQELAAKNPKTLRQQFRERQPEQSYAEAMKAVFGDTPLPEFPKPPYEPAMQIDVPEKQLVGQWRLGAWHLKRHSRKVDPRNPFRGLCANGDWEPDANIYEVNIWPPRGVDGTAIGAETFQILMALDMLGVHDVAEGGLNFWLKARKHAEGNFNGRARVNYFSDFDGLFLLWDYDMKHANGFADILRAAALHARMTEDRAWVKSVAPKLRAACDFIVRQRKTWNAAIPDGVWAKGLQAPMSHGDGMDLAYWYLNDETMYAALRQVAQVLMDHGFDAADLLREAEAYRNDIHAAAEVSIARTPVVRVADGTYRRWISRAPYERSVKTHSHTTIQLRFACSGILAPDEAIFQEMLDVIEDSMSRVFESGGHREQIGYENYWRICLLSDDVPLFLRAMYNGYAADIRPWQDDNIGTWPQKRVYEFRSGRLKNGNTERRPASYVFSEGPFGSPDLEKVFEEAAFLERVRSLLVMEIGDVLWLAKATPRVWLEQGKKIAIKNAPTHFGTVAYEIVSDVDNGKITATVEMPSRKVPKEVVLRFRHPKSAPIKSVTVNGNPWTEFNKDKETITLKDLTGTVAATAQY